jgi:L-alanine-DL-glutamate epimerase-like enolase superfamily enzyme
MAERVRRLRYGVTACPLIKPYDLSFVSLTAFDSVWVVAEYDDGRVGIGEAVALPGYGWETLETVSRTVAAVTAGADDQSREAIVARCREVRAEHPFAASAVMTALELPAVLGHARPDLRFPVSAPVAADWPLPDLRRTVEGHLAAGFDFIKVKIGRDLDRDIVGTRCVLTEWPGKNFRLVFDANQAYSTDAALAFARELSGIASSRLQWFEQPVDRDDWDAMERVCRSRHAPVVLDECIYTEADVERAARIGANGVKLKLMKNFGIEETLSLARKARALGLFVVFGNGVATDVGNLGEYLVLAAGQGLFEPPTESNGFAKMREPLLGKLLKIDDSGSLRCSEADGGLRSRVEEFAQRAG